MKCNEKYLLDSMQDAHCMSCRAKWNREFLVKNFTKTFTSKKYKEHRENVLLDREKSMMPDTQIYVQMELKIRKLSSQRFFAMRNVTEARYNLNRVLMNTLLFSEFENLDKKIEDRSIAITNLNNSRTKLEIIEDCLKYITGLRNDSADVQRVKRVFIRACVSPDCKGFLTSDWKCGICEKTTCSDCHEIKCENHECDPSNVETAKIISRDSKSCPGCGSMIFKIDGCDQMWCTICHTAFSWRTGAVENTIIHNPHYYEFMRINGGMPRNPLDRPCGGLPEWEEVGLITGDHRCYRSVIHARYVIMPQFEKRTVEPNDNKELRIKFMINEISEEKFKNYIQRHEKNRQKNNEVYNIIETFVNVLTDLFQCLVQEKNVVKFTKESRAIRLYINEALSAVSKNFDKCRVPKLLDSYQWDI